MKRRFTLIITALMLMMTSFAWGQTRTTVTDELTRDMTGVTGTTYASWSDVTSNSDAVYAGQSAGGNNSIQLRSNNNNSGIITTESGGTVASISVVWNSNTANGRTLNIYGSDAAYTDPTELYNSSTQGTLLGTIVYGTSTSLTIEESYEYIGMRSANGAMWLEEIDITWTTGGSPTQHVATPTFNPAGGTYYEAQNVSIACTTAGATIHYTLDGSTPTANSATYSSPIAISQTTTIKAIGVKSGMDNSNVATATYTIQDAPTVMTIEEAKALANNEYALVQGVVTFIDGRNVYIQDETAGIDLYFNSAVSTLALGDEVMAYGKKSTFNGLIELTSINPNDGTQFSVVSTGNALPLAVKTIAEILEDHQSGALALQSTRVKIVEATVGTINTNNNTPITQDENSLNIYKMPAVDGLEEGDIINVIGVVGCYNNPQLRVALASDVEIQEPQPTQTVATPTFNPTAGTYNTAQNVSIVCTTEGATIHYTLDGTTPTANSATYSAPIAISETTTVKAIGVKTGMNNSNVATAVYTIEITPPTPGEETTYTLITNANALVSGDKYIMVGVHDEAYKALGKQTNNNRSAVEVTADDNTITLVPASAEGDEAVYELTLGQEDGNWTLFDAVYGGYLYAASSSSNWLRTQAENDENGQWTIEIATDGVATITAQGANTRNWLRYNSGNAIFSCYGSNSSQLDVYLYKAGDVPTPPTPTYYSVSVAPGIANGTVTVNPTTALSGATITVTATPDDNYELATLTYSYGQTTVNINQTTMQFTMPAANVTVNATFTEATPVSPITIAEARALAINEYALVQGVVTFIDGRNIYIQDETAGIDLYLNNNTIPSTLAIGDMVKAYGKIAVFKGLVELSGINGGNADEFSILSTGNELPLAVKTIAEIMEDASGDNMLQSTRVKIVNATIGEINTSNNTPITQDENTLNIYKMPEVEGLIEGDLVTVIGVIGCYNTPQLRIATADDVEFTHQDVPMITVNPTSLSGFTYIYEEGPSEVKTFVITGANITATTYVYPSENYEISSYPGETFVAEDVIAINTAIGTYNNTIKVRLKEGLNIGAYNENLTINQEEVGIIDFALSGNVTNDQPQPPQPQPGEYARVSDLAQLTSGSKVIFAARYNEIANEYFAMTAQASGKPEGVLFTSVAGSDGETLPAEITDAEDTFYWTVGVNGGSYTFTNTNGDVLGYTSSTNFANGGDNTAWSITYQTSEEGAMVPNYSGFVVNNVNVEVRAIALNSNHNFGPYHVQNMDGEGYNFFLDMFATTGGGTMTCGTPVFTPAGGLYYTTQEVTITCSTADATIYYTVDGTDPDESSAVYSEPITVAENMTIKAIAMKEGYENSALATAVYTITAGVVTIFEQDWEGDMNGWTFVTVEGSKPWNISQYQGNHYAYANGYNGGANEQWCISPAFSLNVYGNVSLNFRNAKNYNGPDMQLFFSNDYDGSDPTAATWVELEYVKSPGSYTWTESGSIDLAGFAGDECYIGFKYTSTETEAAAWEVDDVTLMGFTTDPYLTVTPNALSGFTYIVGNGPSQVQTFTVSGGNLPPAPGGTTGGIRITCSNTHYEFSLDGEEFWPYTISIQATGTLEPTTVYVRLGAGLYVGQWDGVVTFEDGGLEVTATVSGTVTEEPIPGGDWNRILTLADLHDGDQVIIASRYDATIGDGYYAMTAGVSGKPDGVLFTSVSSGGVETLPAEITNDAETYQWTVTVDDDVITLTNAAGDMLGYSSSTNFSANTSTDWNIALETSEEGALIPNYTGFVITNAETTNRGIAKNASNKFGAYSTSNIANPDYNFFMDLFVYGGSVTPTVATPVFSMASGTYYQTIEVGITCSTAGATIYYTTDGSDPTAESEVYEEPIEVAYDMTIKAIAMKEGFDNSGIATASYVIMSDIEIIMSQDWEGDMDGWTFVTIEGNKPWVIGTYNNNHYANANGYGDDVDNEQWCISPAFDLSSRTSHNVTLTFMNATKFTGPSLELYFSNDYDGQDPINATWVPLSFIASEGNYVWTESGDISLNAFSGQNCNIGFRYISTIDEGAAAWEIDDIMIVAEMGVDPYLSATPNALSGFAHFVGAGPSDAQTFVLTGGNLPPAPGSDTGSVTLTVDNGFEISLDGEIYTDYSITIPYVVGTLEPTTVYVRLNGEQEGHYEGTITIEDYVEITVALSGDVSIDGIDEALASSVSIWNNVNELMISNSSNRMLNVVVYNIVGQPVLSETVATGTNVIRHDLAEGVYIVRVANGKDMKGIKVVVRR
jgi:hypothetical protein